MNPSSEESISRKNINSRSQVKKKDGMTKNICAYFQDLIFLMMCRPAMQIQKNYLNSKFQPHAGSHMETGIKNTGTRHLNHRPAAIHNQNMSTHSCFFPTDTLKTQVQGISIIDLLPYTIRIRALTHVFSHRHMQNSHIEFHQHINRNFKKMGYNNVINNASKPLKKCMPR